MTSTTAGKPLALSDTPDGAAITDNIVTRKVWLPKFLYDALPIFYLTSGIAALVATQYISEWFWVMPHYLLFSAACIHLAISIYCRRSRKKEAVDTEQS